MDVALWRKARGVGRQGAGAGVGDTQDDIGSGGDPGGGHGVAGAPILAERARIAGRVAMTCSPREGPTYIMPAVLFAAPARQAF